MKKRVNIYPRSPITSTNPPIRGVVKNVTKDVSDIRRCIIAGAKVEEIGPNNEIILLNLRNYDMDTFYSKTALEEGIPVNNKVELNYAAAVASTDVLTDSAKQDCVEQQEINIVDLNEEANGDTNGVPTVYNNPYRKPTKRQRRPFRPKYNNNDALTSDEAVVEPVAEDDTSSEEIVETKDAEDM